MAALIHLDTHAAVWLSAGETARLPAHAPALLRQSPPAISPMVLLELDFLYETGKIKVPSHDIFHDLVAKIGLTIAPTSFEAVAREASGLTWTRDPFDRLITATARAAGARLLTKDATILANETCAFWDHAPPS
jgi:PIN domain nuclease of toxin-antitoxin system